MAIGRQLTPAMINDCLMQTGQSVGHTMVMLDQVTDALGPPLVAADFATIGFTGSDPADVVAQIASWTRLLRFIRGQDAAPVQENFRPGIKKVVGINF